MTLAIADAEAILHSRLGEPAKPPTRVGLGTPCRKAAPISCRVSLRMPAYF